MEWVKGSPRLPAPLSTRMSGEQRFFSHCRRRLPPSRASLAATPGGCGTVALCGFRPRSQRRDRAGFSPASLASVTQYLQQWV